MSSSELKLYFRTYYQPLVYFVVFSIYLFVFHEFILSPKQAKKKIWGIFWIFEFFFPLFSRGGGNYWENSGNCNFFLFEKKRQNSTLKRSRVFGNSNLKKKKTFSSKKNILLFLSSAIGVVNILPVEVHLLFELLQE